MWPESHHGQTATINTSFLKISFEIRIVTTNSILLCEQLMTPPPHFLWDWEWLSLRMFKCHSWVALISPEKSRLAPDKHEFLSILAIWHYYSHEQKSIFIGNKEHTSWHWCTQKKKTKTFTNKLAALMVPGIELYFYAHNLNNDKRTTG